MNFYLEDLSKRQGVGGRVDGGECNRDSGGKLSPISRESLGKGQREILDFSKAVSKAFWTFSGNFAILANTGVPKMCPFGIFDKFWDVGNLRHCCHFGSFCNIFVSRLFFYGAFFEPSLDASHFLSGHFLKVMV